jgi:hypothetical protein
MSSRKSPQEKKALSYAKDRRDDYGENDKASRKNLPRKRARVHRANRHRAHQELSEATGPADEQAAETAENALRGKRERKFRKAPDVTLAQYVAQRLRRRSER